MPSSSDNLRLKPKMKIAPRRSNRSKMRRGGTPLRLRKKRKKVACARAPGRLIGSFSGISLVASLPDRRSPCRHRSLPSPISSPRRLFVQVDIGADARAYLFRALPVSVPELVVGAGRGGITVFAGGTPSRAAWAFSLVLVRRWC